MKKIIRLKFWIGNSPTLLQPSWDVNVMRRTHNCLEVPKEKFIEVVERMRGLEKEQDDFKTKHKDIFDDILKINKRYQDYVDGLFKKYRYKR